MPVPEVRARLRRGLVPGAARGNGVRRGARWVGVLGLGLATLLTLGTPASGEEVPINPPPDESLLHPRNPPDSVARNFGIWNDTVDIDDTADEDNETRFEELTFRKNGWLGLYYFACAGIKYFHAQHTVRLPNSEDGHAYLAVTTSDSIASPNPGELLDFPFGRISVYKSDSLVDPETDLIPDNPGTDGEVVWEDWYTVGPLPSPRGIIPAHPGGAFNHPGKMEVIGNLLLVSMENWDGNDFCDDGLHGVQPAVDAVFFYDIRDPENPQYWGKLDIEADLGVEGVVNDVALIEKGDEWILTAAKKWWRASEVRPDKDAWTFGGSSVAFNQTNGGAFYSYEAYSPPSAAPTSYDGSPVHLPGRKRAIGFNGDADETVDVDGDGFAENLVGGDEYLGFSTAFFCKGIFTKVCGLEPSEDRSKLELHNSIYRAGPNIFGGDSDYDAAGIYVTGGAPILYAARVAEIFSAVGDPIYQIHTPTNVRMTLAEALSTTPQRSDDLDWTTGGDGSWFAQSGVANPSQSAQSSWMFNGEATFLETTITGPATVSFDWKVSSELGGDTLRFEVDGNPHPDAPNPISGDVDWQTVGIGIDTPGEHTLTWIYEKNGSGASGSDAAWVDNVELGTFGDDVVVTTATDDVPGSLRERMVFAPSGSRIVFSPDLDGDAVTLTAGPLTIEKDLTIDASGLPGGLVINANNGPRAVQLVSGIKASLDGLTITGAGTVGDPRGAISIPADASLTCSNCKISGNSNIGIANNGTLTLTDTTVSGNTPSELYGVVGRGGLWNANLGTATLLNTTVSGNTALIASGIYNEGTLTLINSTIAENTAPDPSTDFAPALNNVGTATLIHTTIAGNATRGCHVVTTVNSVALNLKNSIISRPGGPVPSSCAVFGPINHTGRNLLGDTWVTSAGFGFAGDPGLQPLGDNGGPTQTMALSNDSPAVDAALQNTGVPATDQRGEARSQGYWPDIGAVEFSTFAVTEPDDAGAGTLRQAIADAAPGGRVAFSSGLSGSTITLESGPLTIGKDLVIDASGLPGGLEISGNNASRVVEVTSGAVASLIGLTLTEGVAALGGGAIQNSGTLTVTDSTVSGNESGAFGGGIASAGLLTLINTTVSGNQGGGIFVVEGSLTLRSTTISNNTADPGSGAGIAISNAAATLTIEDSIVAGNDGHDIRNLGATINKAGANLIGNNDTVHDEFDDAEPLHGSPEAPLDPGLGPLSDNGGPTWTMLPLPGSPALDSAGASSLATDQRGYPRPDGPASDLGAVELSTLVVSSTENDGEGSLRQAISTARPASSIVFAPGLSGSKITLSARQLTIEKNLTIDASGLPGGIEISGGNSFFRVLEVTDGSDVTLRGLTINEGSVSDVAGGGGILNHGTLTVEDSTLKQNTSTAAGGGALANDGGDVTLRNTTVVDNDARGGSGQVGVGYGGALRNDSSGTMTLINSTVYRNWAEYAGGIFNPGGGELTLIHSTVAKNRADFQAGGIFNLGALTLRNSIIAENTALPPDSPGHDIWNRSGGVITADGANLIGDNDTVSDEFDGADPLHGTLAMPLHPGLGPLGDNGGPTWTSSPFIGSPALDAAPAAANGLALDQRGFPRPEGAFSDLGAVEFVCDMLVDLDCDGVDDADDKCPAVPNGWGQTAIAGVGNQTDTDGDSAGDACDDDDDGDGLSDDFELAYEGFDPLVGGEELQDPDEDGLTNLDEQTAGTNPTNPDSDGDDLLDGFEDEYGFDPLTPGETLQDQDTDGLTNLDEQRLGTDPTKGDTDGDGLGDFEEVMLTGDFDGEPYEITSFTARASGARSVFAADVNGDERVDVLSASQGDDKIAWYRNDGTPLGPWPADAITEPPDSIAAFAQSVFAADIDGDGDVDALSASPHDDKIAWYENVGMPGDGLEWNQVAITTSADGANSAVAVDVDKDPDGDLDVFYSAEIDNEVGWLENTGTPKDASSWVRHTINDRAFSVPNVSAGDIDGDTYPDALAASYDGLIWYENPAGGGSWTRHVIPIPFSCDCRFTVSAADVDGDGDVDALYAMSHLNTVGWFENVNGNGMAWDHYTIATDAFGVSSVFAADIDEDGDPDVLSAAEGGNTVAWHEKVPGDGSAWTTHEIATDALEVHDVFAADVDDDGDLDALAAVTGDDAIVWYQQLGSPTDPLSVDTDGDGLCDGNPGDEPPEGCTGFEDENNNGVVDPGETDPTVPPRKRKKGCGSGSELLLLLPILWMQRRRGPIRGNKEMQR